ncbi:TMEM175 family protein [Streptomyces sp. NPDC059680]|uniref:TMEM175 family protein n=1 Tax=Streptomyces sp. NPDC059680 TaxID=3346904 RepID=UPI0036BF7F71
MGASSRTVRLSSRRGISCCQEVTDRRPPAAGRVVRTEEDDHVSTSRLLALTDGVAAIALTLLVLEIKPPAGLRGTAMEHALDETWSDLGAFALSAAVSGLFRRAHHAVVRGATHVDTVLFWLNRVSRLREHRPTLADCRHVLLGGCCAAVRCRGPPRPPAGQLKPLAAPTCSWGHRL